MENSRIIHLLVKRFKGLLGAREEEELQRALQHPEDRGQADEYEKVWQLSARYAEGYEPDVEGGLQRFRQRLREEEAAPPARRRLGRLLAAAAAAVLLLLLWQPWTRGTRPAAPPLVYETGPGEQRVVELPDGSRAILNEASRLTCRGDWSSASSRALQLSGEAFFEVEERPRQPFLITAGDAEVRVLGTSFNVRAYPEENTTEVSVESGVVEFAPAAHPGKLRLQKRDKGIWERDGNLYVEANGGLNARAWRTGRLHFRATPLREVVRALDHYLDVRLELGQAGLADCTFNFPDLGDDQLDEMLKAMEVIFEADVKQLGPGHYRLHGGGCDQ